MIKFIQHKLFFCGVITLLGCHGCVSNDRERVENSYTIESKIRLSQYREAKNNNPESRIMNFQEQYDHHMSQTEHPIKPGFQEEFFIQESVRAQALSRQAEVMFEKALLEMQKGHWANAIDLLSDAEYTLDNIYPLPKERQVVRETKSDAYYKIAVMSFEYFEKRPDEGFALLRAEDYVRESLKVNPENQEAQILLNKINYTLQRQTS